MKKTDKKKLKALVKDGALNGDIIAFKRRLSKEEFDELCAWWADKESARTEREVPS